MCAEPQFSPGTVKHPPPVGGNKNRRQAVDRTSADGEHTIVVIMVLTCGNAESA